MTIKSFGFIWENLSITPCVPKSGEHDDHIAPNALAAKKHSTVSIWLIVYAAILSFSLILFSLKKLIIFKVSLFNSFQDFSTLYPFSLIKVIAFELSFFDNKFSA